MENGMCDDFRKCTIANWNEKRIEKKEEEKMREGQKNA